MNKHEAERIAASKNRIRTDWPVKQLMTLLGDRRLCDRPARDVDVALTWIAWDPTTTSPYRVLESGPWWIATAVDGQTTGRREPFDRAETCHICGRSEQQCRRNPFAEHEFISHHDYARRTDLHRNAKETA